MTLRKKKWRLETARGLAHTLRAAAMVRSPMPGDFGAASSVRAFVSSVQVKKDGTEVWRLPGASPIPIRSPVYQRPPTRNRPAYIGASPASPSYQSWERSTGEKIHTIMGVGTVNAPPKEVLSLFDKPEFIFSRLFPRIDKMFIKARSQPSSSPPADWISFCRNVTSCFWSLSVCRRGCVAGRGRGGRRRTLAYADRGSELTAPLACARRAWRRLRRLRTSRFATVSLNSPTLSEMVRELISTRDLPLRTPPGLLDRSPFCPTSTSLFPHATQHRLKLRLPSPLSRSRAAHAQQRPRLDAVRLAPPPRQPSRLRQVLCGPARAPLA